MYKLWIVSIVVNIILFGILTAYVGKVNAAIDNSNIEDINKNFKYVEVLVYLIVAFNYIYFLSKILKPSDKKPRRHHGVTHMSLVLILVLLCFTLHCKSCLKMLETNPLPQSLVKTNFKLTENMVYITFAFVIISNLSCLYVNFDQIKKMSPKFKNFFSKRKSFF